MSSRQPMLALILHLPALMMLLSATHVAQAASINDLEHHIATSNQFLAEQHLYSSSERATIAGALAADLSTALDSVAASSSLRHAGLTVLARLYTASGSMAMATQTYLDIGYDETAPPELRLDALYMAAISSGTYDTIATIQNRYREFESLLHQFRRDGVWYSEGFDEQYFNLPLLLAGNYERVAQELMWSAPPSGSAREKILRERLMHLAQAVDNYQIYANQFDSRHQAAYGTGTDYWTAIYHAGRVANEIAAAWHGFGNLAVAHEWHTLAAELIHPLFFDQTAMQLVAVDHGVLGNILLESAWHLRTDLNSFFDAIDAIMDAATPNYSMLTFLSDLGNELNTANEDSDAVALQTLVTRYYREWFPDHYRTSDIFHASMLLKAQGLLRLDRLQEAKAVLAELSMLELNSSYTQWLGYLQTIWKEKDAALRSANDEESAVDLPAPLEEPADRVLPRRNQADRSLFSDRSAPPPQPYLEHDRSLSRATPETTSNAGGRSRTALFGSLFVGAAIALAVVIALRRRAS